MTTTKAYLHVAYANALGAGYCKVLETAREEIAPTYPLVDKPGKGEVYRSLASIRGRNTLLIGVKVRFARNYLTTLSAMSCSGGNGSWSRRQRRPSQGNAYLSQVPLFFSFLLSGAQSLLKLMEHGV